MTPVTRRAILKRFPWLKAEGLPMVISADYEGLLAACLLHHILGWRLAGYISDDILWLSDHIPDPNGLVAVNAGLLGHGVKVLPNPQWPLPADVTAGGPDQIDYALPLQEIDGEKSQQGLSLVLFLIWLHRHTLRRDLLARLMVLYADQAWIRLGQPEAIKTIAEQFPGYDWGWLLDRAAGKLFARRMEEELYPRLTRLSGITPPKKIVFNPDWDTDIILNLTTLIGTVLKWSPPHLPVHLTRHEAAGPPLNADQLRERLRNEELIVNSIGENGELNFIPIKL